MTPEQFEEITEWQKATFGQATTLSKLKHLSHEVIELFESVEYKFDDKDIRHEFADCFFLLFGAAAAHGMSYEDVCAAIDEKFEINKKRKWGKPDANGVVNHIED